jgi:uncharacterized membrane protein YfcA
MALESLPLALLAWVVCAIVLAGLVQGAIGFGFPFVATPLIAMTADMRTAVIMVVLPTLVLNFINLASSGPLRPALRRFWMMPLYAIVGAFAGTWLFVTVPDAPYALFLALITFVYLAFDHLSHSAWPRVVRHERAFGVLAGGAAGLFEGTVNVAGPPLIIYYLALGLVPAMMVQALNICFAVGKVVQFSVLATRGGVTAAEWMATVPLVAIGIAAFFVGLRIRNRIDAPTYRLWVKRALFVIALVLLAQQAWSLAG